MQTPAFDAADTVAISATTAEALRVLVSQMTDDDMAALGLTADQIDACLGYYDETTPTGEAEGIHDAPPEVLEAWLSQHVSPEAAADWRAPTAAPAH